MWLFRNGRVESYEVAEGDGHNNYFHKVIYDNIYAGRYKSCQNRISISIPELKKHNKIPNILIRQLYSVFNQDAEIWTFQSGSYTSTGTKRLASINTKENNELSKYSISQEQEQIFVDNQCTVIDCRTFDDFEICLIKFGDNYNNTIRNNYEAFGISKEQVNDLCAFTYATQILGQRFIAGEPAIKRSTIWNDYIHIFPEAINQ